MRAALRRRKREVHKKLHTHIRRERDTERRTTRNVRAVGRGERESGGWRRSLGKRINIDRFWKVGRRGRRTAICSRSQDARWGKKMKKNSGKA